MGKFNVRAVLFSAALCTSLTAGAYSVSDDDGATYNPLQTAIPSLSIAPDAVGGGMGDVGAATKPDNVSQYWNPAKYAQAESKGGFSLSYTPWLRQIVNDIYLAYLSGYYTPTDRTSVGASFRYFSMGEIHLTGQPTWNNEPIDQGTAKPYEFAVDGSFSMLLSEYWSAGVALRFIYSYLFNGALDEDEYSSAKAIGADIAFSYRRPLQLGANTSYVGVGMSISNIGNKVSYDGDQTQQFIPTNFRLGTSFDYAFDEFNRLQIAIDMNKLLVPTPYGNSDQYATEEEFNEAVRDYEETTAIGGIFKSLGDAPGGFKEELREINFSVGLQYSYNNKFMVRGGYFNENKYKGNRKYFSVGAGFNLSIFQLSAAYVITTAQTNPLDKTLRFSLGFDLGGLKDIFGVNADSGATNDD